MLQRPWSSWGFGALLKEERALIIHSPHLQFECIDLSDIKDIYTYYNLLLIQINAVLELRTIIPIIKPLLIIDQKQ